MSTLSVTDNADGTGAVATITGSSGGANVVYVQNVDGELGSLTWTAAGNRTGDGTVSLAPAKGYYWAYCLTGGTALSGLVYFQVTDGLDSVLSRCAAAVKARLQLLALPPTALVLDTINDRDPGEESYPCTVLTTEGASQTNESALNGRDDLGQPVRCLVKDVCTAFDSAQLQTYRLWRQGIFRAFHNQRLPGVIESVRNRVELGAVTPTVSDRPQMVFELLIRCVTREVRGLGA